MTTTRPTSTSSQQVVATLKLLSLVIFAVTGSVTWQLTSTTSTGQVARQASLLDIPYELCGGVSRHIHREEAPEKANPPTLAPTPEQELPALTSCQQEYQRVTSNRTQGITEQDLEQSRALIGNRHRLAQLSAKLQRREEPVNAVVCGGSITIGHGVVP